MHWFRVSCFVLKDVCVVCNSPMVRSLQAISRGPTHPLFVVIHRVQYWQNTLWLHSRLFYLFTASCMYRLT